jgi:adenosylmethionine-8-amino-7-oxononanoate aminotransferase
VLGTVAAFELAAEGEGYLAGIGRALAAHALERDVLLRPLGDTCYLLPPYCTTDEDLAHAYDVIREFLDTPRHDA